MPKEKLTPAGTTASDDRDDGEEGGDPASPPCFMHEVDPDYIYGLPADPAERIVTRKIHDGISPYDGHRALVERLWPRGVSKTAAALDSWQKDLAPSPELRRWYAHDTSRWPEFQDRYRAELATRDTELEKLQDIVREGRLTLLFSSHESRCNSATVLREVLVERVQAQKEKEK